MGLDSQAFKLSVLTSIRRGFSGTNNCTEAIGIVRTELARFPVRLRGNRGNLYPRAWSIIGIHDD